MNLDFLFLRRAFYFSLIQILIFLTIPQDYGAVIISWQFSWLKKSSKNDRLACYLQYIMHFCYLHMKRWWACFFPRVGPSCSTLHALLEMWLPKEVARFEWELEGPDETPLFIVISVTPASNYSHFVPETAEGKQAFKLWLSTDLNVRSSSYRKTHALKLISGIP